MRNLKSIHRSVLASPPGLKLTASAWDAASDSVICAFGPTRDTALLELKRWRKHDKALEPIAAWDAPCPLPDLECDVILNLHYFSDSSTICLVFAGGDLILVRQEPKAGEERIEIVGSVDAGISGAAWSPDEELLAITTRASTLLYMTRDFENVTDITFTFDDLKASNHVSVGWGKKETQFKGKKARALRDPTVPETVDEGLLNDKDAKETTISWRGDGAYLAINSIESDSRRVVRVFSREGILDSVSEPVDGLVGALSWRPTGNLLAGIQRFNDCVKVVFFERNGLRHGHFDLRLNEVELSTWGSQISLNWNVDSSVLAVRYNDRVQLWAMGNYYYYLKQEVFLYSKENCTQPVSLNWHPEKSLHFTLHGQETLQRAAYASIVTIGPTSPPNDYGVVAVVDGKRLKLTPMRLANVPPPMALHEIEINSSIIDVAITIRSNPRPRAVIGVLHHQGYCQFEWSLKSMVQNPPVCRLYLQTSFSGNASLLFSKCIDSSSFTITGEDGDHLGQISLYETDIEGMIKNSWNPKSKTYVVLDHNGKPNSEESDARVRGFNVVGMAGIELALSPLSLQTVDATVCGFEIEHAVNGLANGAETPATKDVVFSLAENGSLFANERRLARNCTSFLVTPAHLIFTTSQHLLKLPIDLEIPPDTPESDERCRSIERGARLVTVMPSIFALVLQMPRGNLETIYPRALVLAGIRDSINKRDYRKAFLACRNQRVDMNILHDHAPLQFVSTVPLFIDQVKKVEHIDLFLSQLREEDVSKTIYKETLPGVVFALNPPNVKSSTNGISKVNLICDAFLDALRNRTSTHFQNVISAHVCKAPPDLDAGLIQIAGLRSQDSDLVDAAIEHICFLADVNRLYDNALGLYDLELALLVAQQSQKDPKEYLPFLRNLQGMPMLRRQYSIDSHLGRFRKALRHLCDLSAFDEVMEYTKKHGLYPEALDFYRYQEDKLKEMMRLYADFLLQNGKFKEAGVAYEYLNDYSPASEAFRQAHLWKESLSCATLIPLPHPQLRSLAQTLADTLSESKDFFSAAIIHLDYLADVPNAARIFCKGYFFADALRTVGLHRRSDLVDSVIDTGLVEGMASMTELLADCKSQLNAQIPRLRELRTKKAEDPLAFLDGDVNGGADIPDNVSLATTDASTMGGTLLTRYTNRTGTVGTNATRRTSKNRRREERKRARGKKGSVYEEEYLVNSVGRLIDRVNTTNEEVDRLVVGLMRRGMRERAGAVEDAIVEVVELCKGCVDEVFRSDVKEAVEQKEDEEGEGRPKGGEGVRWDALEGDERREAPVVKIFDRLSLLGR
ncbi:MAG: hypothetical protein ASARMPREDX12_004578 [Alectoria sarmentosa]|nr:MAG: hypothetical protein ASARMPREDX12_004578 [Alectoria sarmentosa]